MIALAAWGMSLAGPLLGAAAGLPVIGFLVKYWKFAAVGLAVVAVLIVAGRIHRHGTLGERARWEARVDRLVAERTERYRVASEHAAQRAALSDAQRVQTEYTLTEIRDAAKRYTSNPVCIPGPVTRQLRSLR